MKKRTYKLLISSMIVTSFFFASSIAGFALTVNNEMTAEPTVTLSKSSTDGVEFTINRSDTDLFDNFKNVIPGDELTQNIKIKDDVDETAGGSTYRIYLYAENGETSKLDSTEAAPADLMDQIKITVAQGDSELTLEKTGSNTQGTYLGEFAYGDVADLKVTMTVPKELGNEYQSCKGSVNWYFYAEQVEEEDIEEDDTPLNPPPFENIVDDEIPLNSLPKTGTSSRIVMLEIVAACSIIALVALNFVRVKNKQKQN